MTYRTLINFQRIRCQSLNSRPMHNYLIFVFKNNLFDFFARTETCSFFGDVQLMNSQMVTVVRTDN